MKNNILLIFGLTIASALLVSCGGYGAEVKQESEDLVIFAAAADFDTMGENGYLYEKGIDLAVKEINQSGGIKGNELSVIKYDDNNSPAEGSVVADELVGDKRIMAVLGHFNSATTVPLSYIYEEGKLPMITPVSMDDRITLNVYNNGSGANYEYLFRLNLTGTQAGYSLAAYVNQLGFEKTAMFYSDDRICKYIADSFDDEQSYRYKTPIIDRICQYGNEPKMDSVIDRWQALDCDSVVINNLNINYTLSFIDRMRKNNMNVPLVIINHFAYDNSEILDYIENAGDGDIYCLPLFHPDMEYGNVKEFSDQFEDEYDVLPDWFAMQAYEMVMITAKAAENCEIITRENIAKALHETKGFKGVMGEYSIDEKGDLWGKNYALYKYEDGQFVFIDYDEETLKGDE